MKTLILRDLFASLQTGHDSSLTQAVMNLESLLKSPPVEVINADTNKKSSKSRSTAKGLLSKHSIINAFHRHTISPENNLENSRPVAKKCV